MREEMKYSVYIHSEDINEEWNALKSEVDSFMTETYGNLLDN
jgi:hypothetical protein